MTVRRPRVILAHPRLPRVPQGVALRAAEGFTLIELICTVAILGVLAAVALPKFLNFGNDAQIAQFAQYMTVARTNINSIQSQAILQAGHGNFTVGGCVGNIDTSGNGTGCFADGTAAKVASFNLTCWSGIFHAGWFAPAATVYYASDSPGSPQWLKTANTVAGNTCYVQCVTGTGVGNQTTLTMRPDLAYTAGISSPCPSSYDIN